MFSYRQFIIAFTRLERFIHRCHIVSCIEKPTGSFSRLYVSIVTLLTATFVVCPLTFTAADWNLYPDTSMTQLSSLRLSLLARKRSCIQSMHWKSRTVPHYRVLSHEEPPARAKSKYLPVWAAPFFHPFGPYSLCVNLMGEIQNIGLLIRTHYPVGVVLWQSRSNDPLMGEHNIFE